MPSKSPVVRIQDILDNIERIESHVAGSEVAAFLGDRKTRDAVERCLARISEAAVKLGAAAEDLAPDQPWRGIRDLGNVLRHAYDEIEPMRIWRLVMDDLPALKTACQTALERVRHEDQA